ncbi:ester cyclase [Streptomyces sp. NPDC004647]|uniref:ester cyclase n=1 Tax=Streptomyces sp. NPDC004647 TaxID=3154671 RepID=UPI00339DB29F
MATTASSPNRQLLEHYYEECLNKGNLDAVHAKAVQDHISHGTVAEGFEGVAHLREWVRIQRASFPDLHVVVEDWIEEGDKVVQRFTARGSHTGAEYHGIPASGRSFEIWGIVIDLFKDNKIVESWFSMDSLELVKQLGALE